MYIYTYKHLLSFHHYNDAEVGFRRRSALLRCRRWRRAETIDSIYRSMISIEIDDQLSVSLSSPVITRSLNFVLEYLNMRIAHTSTNAFSAYCEAIVQSRIAYYASRVSVVLMQCGTSYNS